MNLWFFCYLSIIDDKERPMRSKRDQWDQKDHWYQRKINDPKFISIV